VFIPSIAKVIDNEEKTDIIFHSELKMKNR